MEECRLIAQVKITFEEGLIGLIPQALAQLIMESLDGRVGFEGMLRIARQVDQAGSICGADRTVAFDQHDTFEQTAPIAAGICEIEQGQVTALYGAIVPAGCLRGVEEAAQHPVGRQVQDTFHQGDLRLHGQFVALVLLEQRVEQRAQMTLQVFLVLAAEVEPATQGGEVRGRDGAF